MYWVNLSVSFVMVYMVLMPAVLAGDINDQSHCDLVGPNALVLKNLKKPLECQLECEKNQSCQGYVFVSSWNRCFLKSSIKRLVKINLISGLPGQEAKVDHDHSGKDMRQESASNAAGCESLCSKDKTCGAYTFIKGYQTCWLKNKTGSFRAKVFYCGRKS